MIGSWLIAQLAFAAPSVTPGQLKYEAPASLTLSLDQAIRIALEQNPEVDIQVFTEQLAAIEARRARLDRFSITVDAAGSWGVGVVDPPGAAPSFSDNLSYSLDANARWTLFSGGAVVGRIRSAKLGEWLAEHDRHRIERELTRAVFLAYWNIKGLELQIAATRESLTATEDALAIIQAKEKAGLAATLDVNRSTVDLLSQRSELVSQESDLYSAKLELLRLLHFSETEVLLTDSIDRYQGPVLDNDEVWIKRAIEQRPELARLRTQREQAAVDRKVATAGYFPTLSLQAGAGLQADSPLLDEPSEPRPTTYATAGLYLGWTPFDWLKTRDAVQAARIQEYQIDASLASEELAMESDIRQSLTGVRSLREQAKLLSERIELARDNLKIIQELYAQGSASLLELFDAQAAFRSASSQQAAFQVSLVNAEYELRWTVGESFVQE